MRYSILASFILLLSCSEKEEIQFSKYARLLGSWQVNSIQTLKPINEGDVQEFETNFSIVFNESHTGHMYSIITSEFIWTTECGPDILFISQKDESFPVPNFTNWVYEIKEYNNCCRIVLYRNVEDNVNGVDYQVEDNWVLTR